MEIGLVVVIRLDYVNLRQALGGSKLVQLDPGLPVFWRAVVADVAAALSEAALKLLIIDASFLHELLCNDSIKLSAVECLQPIFWLVTLALERHVYQKPQNEHLEQLSFVGVAV